MNDETRLIGSIEVIPLIFFLQEVEKAPGPSTWDMNFIKQKLDELKIEHKEHPVDGSLVNWKGDDVKGEAEHIIEISNGINSFEFGVFDGIGATFILKEPGIIGLDMVLGIYYLLKNTALDIDSMLPEDKSDTANIEFDKIFAFVIESIREVLRDLNLFEADKEIGDDIA